MEGGAFCGSPNPVTPLQEYSPLHTRERDPVAHKSSAGSNKGELVEHPSKTNMFSPVKENGLARSRLKLPEFCIELQVDMKGSVIIKEPVV